MSMKVLFVQFEPQESLAIQYLSAFLRKHGHVTDVLIVGKMNYLRAVKKILLYQPGLVCISDLGSDIQRISCLSSLIKKHVNTKIVVGGYITINQEDVFKNDQNIDAYCIGSGFYLDKLIEHYEHGFPAENIPNFFIRHNGVLVSNSLDSDSHFCDFQERDIDIYRKYSFIYHSVYPFVMASYGCINNCSFCFYSGFKNKFGKRSPLCYKDPDLVIREISQMRKVNKNFNCFSFVDDNIMNNMDWLARLMGAIKPLKIRFLAKIDVNNCTEEAIKMMREAGLFAATIGIEHINQNIRHSVFNKYFTNEKLDKVISWLKKYGVHIRAYFIIGLPNETAENIMENISFAKKNGLRDVKYMFLGLLPYTALTEKMKKEHSGVNLEQLSPFSVSELTKFQMQQNAIFLPNGPLYISQLIRKCYLAYVKLRFSPFGVINLFLYGWRISFYLAKERILNIIDQGKI